jgi:hypothetical protein
MLITLLPLLALGQPALDPEEATDIVVYDMTHLFELDLADPVQRREFWDTTHLVVSLQGIVNRHEPRLYIRYVMPPDEFWWDVMVEPGGWLDGRSIHEAATLDDLVQRFQGDYAGAVVWDERVPATSNVASSIAGADGLLCLRYDSSPTSVYGRLTSGPGALAVQVDLRAADGSPLFTGSGTIPGTDQPSSGSPKCDAYLWLVEHYLVPGRLTPTTMGYYLDGHWLESWMAGSPVNHTLTNQDYVIANGGLVFDLGVWDNEVPVDDPTQPPGTDADTLRAILRAAYEAVDGQEMIHVSGFVPWAYKYTDFRSGEWFAGGSYSGVPTEWRYAEILSCFNAYMDADALGLGAMANASFFQHYPLEDRYAQNPKPTRESLAASGILDADGRIVPRHYYAHYVGDYDAAAWLYQRLPAMWTDPRRGETPLSWAFNPNLCLRFPLGMAWAREGMTDRDFFVAGDSGAGYLNPGLLTPPRWHSDLPSGMATWERHCQRLYDQWDITLTGFVIDGFGPPLAEEGWDAYARFSPDGIVPQKVDLQGIHGDMPFIRMGTDLYGSPEEAAESIVRRFRGPLPDFHVNRSILQTPSWYAQVDEQVAAMAGGQAMAVDLYTLLWLVREVESNADVYGSEASPYAGAEEVRATPMEADGVYAVWENDGQYRVQRDDTPPYWLSWDYAPTRFLYFDVDDGFADSLDGAALVSVLCAADPGVIIGLHYDSMDDSATLEGAYTNHPATWTSDGSGEWVTIEFPLPDPRFDGRQNAGADLRLEVTGPEVRVADIRIVRVQG